MKKLLLILAALCAACGLSHRALGDVVLYDNGPVDGNTDGFDISAADGFSTADSFSLTNPSVVDGITFATWNFPSDTLSSVDWSISTTALPGTIYGNDPGDAGTTLALGTDPVTNLFLFSNDFGYDIDSNSITIPDLSLDPGTYYLTLSNAVVTGDDPTFWDESNGPSSAYETGTGSLTDFNGSGLSGSETFQILGHFTVPEPSGLVSIAIGALMTGFCLYRRRRKAA